MNQKEALQTVRQVIDKELGNYESPDSLTELGQVDLTPYGIVGFQFIAKEWQDETRWGNVYLTVLELEDSDNNWWQFGIVHEDASGDGESSGKDEWEVVPVVKKVVETWVPA